MLQRCSGFRSSVSQPWPTAWRLTSSGFRKIHRTSIFWSRHQSSDPPNPQHISDSACDSHSHWSRPSCSSSSAQTLTGPNSYNLLFPLGQTSILDLPSTPTPSFPFDVFSIIPPYERNNRSIWIRLVLSLLPENLQQGFTDLPPIEHPLLDSLSPERTQVAINATLFLADRYGGVDILLYFGLIQKRWDVVNWLVDSVLSSAETAPSLKLNSLVPDCLTNIPWPRQTLQQFSSGMVASWDWTPQAPISLDEVTNNSPRLAKVGNDYCYIAIGRICQSLGIMIARATQSPQETDAIMPHILRIIARMHHHGIVPAEVYSYSQDPNTRINSPIIPFLASKMMEALSDAAIKESSPDIFPPKGSFLSSWIPLTPHHTTVFRPELWLEFILWTCVYGGWPLVAARILTFMQSTERDEPWKLINWQNELNHEDPGFLPSESSENDAEIAAKLTRSVSAEVVNAVVNSVISSNQTGIGARGTSVPGIVRYLTVCRSLLDRANIPLRPLSWSAVVNRLLISNLVTIQSDPVTFCDILKLAHPEKAEGSHTSTGIRIQKSGSEGPYYGSSQDVTALFSLYHSTLGALVDRENVQGALRLFNNMLEYGRVAYRHSKSTTQTNIDPNEGGHLLYRNPDIPISVMSNFLDLLTSTGHLEAARTILFAYDRSQLMIPCRLHTNLFISPAVFRYACAADDSKLAITLAKSMFAGITQNNTSPKSVAAAVSAQFDSHNWRAARQLLSTNRDLLKSKWDPSILSDLASVLVKGCPNGPDQDPANWPPTFSSGFTLYFELIKGVFGRCLGGSFSIESTNAVLSQVSPAWSQYCRSFNYARPVSHALPLKKKGEPQHVIKRVTITSHDFKTLVSAVASSHDPILGIKLVDEWCLRPISMPPFDSYADLYPFSLSASDPSVIINRKYIIESAIQNRDQAKEDEEFIAYQDPSFQPVPLIWYGPRIPPVSSQLSNVIPVSELQDRLLLGAACPLSESEYPLDSKDPSYRNLLPILIPSDKDTHVYAFTGRVTMTLGVVRSIFIEILARARITLESSSDASKEVALPDFSSRLAPARMVSINVIPPPPAGFWATIPQPDQSKTPFQPQILTLAQVFEVLPPSLGHALIWCIHRFRWLGVGSPEELEYELQAAWGHASRNTTSASKYDNRKPNN